MDALVPVDRAVLVRRRAAAARAPSSIRRANLQQRNITALGNLQPFLGYGISGVVPLYTFGKIETAREAAEANVRVSEWDMEKWRQSMRMDVRRAYYGVQLARDAREVFTDAIDRLDKAIQGITEKLAKADPNVTDVDRLRLEEFRQEVLSQSLAAAEGRGVRDGRAALHDGRADELRRPRRAAQAARIARSSRSRSTSRPRASCGPT